MDSKTVHNQPHDEEVAISDDDGSGSDEDNVMIDPNDGGMGPAPGARVDSPPRDHDSDDPDSYGGMGGGMGAAMGAAMGSIDHDTVGQGGGDMAGEGPHTEGEYNPMDYAHLDVSDDVKELFQYIGRYKPRPHQLDSKLKCFVPDYIPAVGDIDEFIKVPRPDGKPDFLGLRVLDEPATVQSDPTVLNLQLRQVSKQSGMKPIEVASIEHAAKDPKKIEAWINSIQELHVGKPPPTVSYSKNMPEIEALMQEWPVEMEDLLNQVRLPSGNMDIDLLTLTKVVCNLLDIPVYEGKAIESLHVLFTLYLEFKNNPFLKAQKQAGMGTMGSQNGMMGTMGSQVGLSDSYMAGGQATM